MGQRDISGPLGAERRRREARREMFTTPELVTAQRSILGPPAEGRPGPSDYKQTKLFFHFFFKILILELYFPKCAPYFNDVSHAVGKKIHASFNECESRKSIERNV